MRDLQRLRLAHESRACAFPVPLRVAAQQPDRHRMPERAMRPPVDDALEAAGTEPFAEIVGADESAERLRVADRRRLPVPREEGMAEIAYRLPAFVRVLGQRARDSELEPRRHIGDRLGNPRDRRVEMRVQHADRVGRRERRAPRHHLEHDGAEAVDVRGRVDHAARQLFGRSVRDRAQELVRARQPRLVALPQVRETEVDDLVDALPRRELVRDDVRRLQIAMDDPLIVRELQRGAERRHDRLNVADAHPSPHRDFVPDRRTVEQLHDEKRMLLVVDVEVEDGDDVRVAEPGARAALPEEPLAALLAGVIAADDLDGDLVAEERPPRAIDRPHAAFREQAQNLVALVEDLARGEHRPLKHVGGAAVLPCADAVTRRGARRSRVSAGAVERRRLRQHLERTDGGDRGVSPLRKGRKGGGDSDRRHAAEEGAPGRGRSGSVLRLEATPAWHAGRDTSRATSRRLLRTSSTSCSA